MRSGFSKLLRTLICGKICIYLLRIHYKKRSEKNLFDDDYAIFSDFLYKGICCGYSFELHQQFKCCGYSFELHRLVDAIQMSTHNTSLYKEVNKRYTDCHLKTTKFLDCALIGVCVVIRLNTVIGRRRRSDGCLPKVILEGTINPTDVRPINPCHAE